MEIILFVFTCGIAFGYLLLISNAAHYWDAIEEVTIPKDYVAKYDYTVIIPYRNEEAHLQKCIQSLLDLRKGGPELQIICVDDHSTDGSKTIADGYDEILSLTNGQSGKKAAITTGVEQSKGMYIITLDADCIVLPDWLVLIDQQLQNREVDTLVGAVCMHEEQHVLGRFQYLETAGTMCLIGAGVKSGKFYVSNGANFIFKKRVFDDVGGYEGNEHIASGDDVFLLNKIVESQGSVSFVKSRRATVYTHPMSTIGPLLRQRARWASKTSGYASKNLLWIQGYAFAMALSIVLLTTVGLLLYGAFSLLMGVFLFFLKGVIDYLFLNKMMQFYWGKKVMKWYPISAILYLCYILFMGMVAVGKPKVTWKGRATS